MRRTGFALVVLACVASALVATGTAAAGSAICTGSLGAVTIDGNLTVPAGAICSLNGTHVTGNVTVERGSGGGLGVSPAPDGSGSTIDGSVQVQQGGSATVVNSTIGGDYVCNHCEFADLIISSVHGNFEDNGLTQGAFIIRDSIGGTLVIHDSSSGGGQFIVARNTIGGNLEFVNNDAGAQPSLFISNAIASNFQCQGNTPAPTGFGNTAKHELGQCAGL